MAEIVESSSKKTLGQKEENAYTKIASVLSSAAQIKERLIKHVRRERMAPGIHSYHSRITTKDGAWSLFQKEAASGMIVAGGAFYGNTYNLVFESGGGTPLKIKELNYPVSKASIELDMKSYPDSNLGTKRLKLTLFKPGKHGNIETSGYSFDVSETAGGEMVRQNHRSLPGLEKLDLDTVVAVIKSLEKSSRG